MYVRDIYLHGSLGQQFGHHHRMAVATVAEAIRALSAQFAGFRQVLREGSWRVVRGLERDLGLEEIKFELGQASLHFVPVVEGSGLLETGGKIIGGLALAAAAFVWAPAIPFIGAFVANAGVGIGLSMAAGGITSLMTSKPTAKNGRGGVDQRASFSFGGVENVSQQGVCVPVVIGKFLIGSVVVSAGLMAEQA